MEEIYRRDLHDATAPPYGDWRHASWVGRSFVPLTIGIIAALALPRRIQVETAAELPTHGIEFAAEPVA
jgi:hypothetical protein